VAGAANGCQARKGRGVQPDRSQTGRSRWIRGFEFAAWVGALVFAAGFVVLSVAPAHVERWARPHVIELVQAEAMERYPALRSLSAFSGLAERLRVTGRVTRGLITSEYPEAVARIFSHLCKYECGEEPAVAEVVRSGLTRALDSLGVALGRVESWARDRYGALVFDLIADLRIVSATNAVLFGLAAAALRWGSATKLTLSLAAILFASSLLGAFLYFFQQDWLMTLLFGNYAGVAYLVWVGVIALLLADCTFNRGRVVRALGGAFDG
jgi:hypothetical protein